jgi:hypothetical protein
MKELMVPRILWGAILCSTFLFFVVQFVVRQPGPVEAPLVIVLAGAAVMTALASIVLPSATYAVALRRLKLDSREEDDPSGMPGVTRRRVAANPDEAMRTAIRIFQTPFILGLALSEAISLFGFVLGFLGAPIDWVLPFFVASWLLIWMRFPTRERIFGPAERATGVVIRA